MYNIDKHGQSTNITYMSAHYKALDRPLVLRVLHRHRGRGRVRHCQVGGGDHMERLQRCAAALDTLLASRRRLLHHLWVLFSLWSRWKRFSVSQNVIYLIIKTVKLFPQRWANTSKSTKTLISTQSRWRSRAGARRLSTGRRQYFQISGEVFSSADIIVRYLRWNSPWSDLLQCCESEEAAGAGELQRHDGRQRDRGGAHPVGRPHQIRVQGVSKNFSYNYN